LRTRERTVIFRAGVFALATLSVVTCTADTPPSIGTAEQAVVNPPLPGNLNLILNAKTTVTIGPFARVNGDVGSTGLSGSVLFDSGSSQSCCSGNVLANTVTVGFDASVGHVFGNDITVNGFVSERSLGLDPTAMPAVPAVTPAAPGTTNVSTNQNQAKQLCPGSYGAISLGVNSTLNLNGGVYQVTRLTLADGAKLEPSEPVVILVSGAVTTGIGSFIRPSSQSINPMTAADVRIEVGGSVTIGDNTQVRAHVLVPGGKFTMGKNAGLTGAAWAKTIMIGAQSSIGGEGVFAGHSPTVPPPCNDGNACTADACVGGGTAVAFCRNTPSPSGSSCEDGNVCNGAERCDGAGQCLAGSSLGAGTACPDGDVCNGDETCNGFGSCLPGTPPEVNDRNACTTDVCDATGGVSHVAVPDGTACFGIGVCTAGTCSVSGAVFSDDFFQFQSAPAQCDHWNDFLANELFDGSYTRVTMTGTFDPAGVSCSDPAAATQICQAMHHGNFTSVFCDGHSWFVGQCGGTEVSLDISVCNCNFGTSHTVRPCTGQSWGGMNTETCSPPSQNLTVVCE
jgi:hypothetical protein